MNKENKKKYKAARDFNTIEFHCFFAWHMCQTGFMFSLAYDLFSDSKLLPRVVNLVTRDKMNFKDLLEKIKKNNLSNTISSNIPSYFKSFEYAQALHDNLAIYQPMMKCLYDLYMANKQAIAQYGSDININDLLENTPWQFILCQAFFAIYQRDSKEHLLTIHAERASAAMLLYFFYEYPKNILVHQYQVIVDILGRLKDFFLKKLQLIPNLINILLLEDLMIDISRLYFHELYYLKVCQKQDSAIDKPFMLFECSVTKPVANVSLIDVKSHLVFQVFEKTRRMWSAFCKIFHLENTSNLLFLVARTTYLSNQLLTLADCADKVCEDLEKKLQLPTLVEKYDAKVSKFYLQFKKSGFNLAINIVSYFMLVYCGHMLADYLPYIYVPMLLLITDNTVYFMLSSFVYFQLRWYVNYNIQETNNYMRWFLCVQMGLGLLSLLSNISGWLVGKEVNVPKFIAYLAERKKLESNFSETILQLFADKSLVTSELFSTAENMIKVGSAPIQSSAVRDIIPLIRIIPVYSNYDNFISEFVNERKLKRWHLSPSKLSNFTNTNLLVKSEVQVTNTINYTWIVNGISYTTDHKDQGKRRVYPVWQTNLKNQSAANFYTAIDIDPDLIKLNQKLEHFQRIIETDCHIVNDHDQSGIKPIKQSNKTVYELKTLSKQYGAYRLFAGSNNLFKSQSIDGELTSKTLILFDPELKNHKQISKLVR